jgi:hypothetical protein
LPSVVVTRYPSMLLTRWSLTAVVFCRYEVKT